MSRMRLIITICAVITGLAVATAVIHKLDTRYTCEALAGTVSDDLREHKIEVRMRYLQERMWDIEDRWAARFEDFKDYIHHTLYELIMFMTEEARETYRELMDEYEELEAELEPEKDGDDK